MKSRTTYIIIVGPVSAWQSATLLPISCKLVRPVPARVEEPGSPARQPRCHEQSTLSQDALSQHLKVGCQNWNNLASLYSAAGVEHDCYLIIIDYTVLYTLLIASVITSH